MDDGTLNPDAPKGVEPGSTSGGLSRRELLKTSAGTAGVLLMGSPQAGGGDAGAVPGPPEDAQDAHATEVEALPDMRPARWIWYPSGRCLSNTFMLFRRVLRLPERPRRATGWIGADSRYLLRINGKRVQWGPAPCDPKWLELDPLDIADFLQEGENTIAVQVLFYGHGDGTWPGGKPGFLFWLELEHAEGNVERITSDTNWRVCLPRSWRAGQYKRSFTRALQEDFDARLHPEGWTESGFREDDDWLAPMVLDNPVEKPPICSHYENYMFGVHAEYHHCELRPRSIPLLQEHEVPVQGLADSFRLRWRRPPEEYFETLTPNAYEIDRTSRLDMQIKDGAWRVELDSQGAVVLTLELAEQVVGWPFLTIEAAAGTVIELLVQEAHQPGPGGPGLSNTHWHSWTRFTCREGLNRFETFDYESCRWIQLHIRGPSGPVTVSKVGMRRRMYPWPHEPVIEIDEPDLQQLMNASINTLHNCAQDICVDGMARERQQYSGECGHQLHAIRQTFGELRLPARFLGTFSQGLTVDGYFLDCWPAYDRLARLMSRPVQLAGWGPILDHGIGFVFDCFHHYLYTGDLKAIQEPYPRLGRFVAYLESIRRDGLLPVEDLGVPIVWIDHQAYRHQHHKQCAFNLYAAAMLRHAYAPLCRTFGEESQARDSEAFSDELLAACARRYWNEDRGLYVNNLPWISQEEPRLCDRSLATSVLFNQCPGGRIEPAVRALAEMPAEMGHSYPANANWRLWALAEAGRGDAVLNDLRRRWATMASVRLNNTLQEDWHVLPDTWHQWSHCGVVPLYVTYMCIAGIRPLEPGFGRCEVRPQLADLPGLSLVMRTPLGPLRFQSRGLTGDREMTIALPPGCAADLLVHREEDLQLPRAEREAPPGLAIYRLEAGRTASLRLEHT